MSDVSQTCPPAWDLITSPKRSCGVSHGTQGLNKSAIFSSQGIEYSQVCGRIIGYQRGSTQAFVWQNHGYNDTIESNFLVGGVSLTYGHPRQHIWTFAAGYVKYTCTFIPQDILCPCTSGTAPVTPYFVGDDFFCESGVPPDQPAPQQSSDPYMIYSDDPLWDGQGCGPTSTCCTFNNPPWFCKYLPHPTSADLEVRISGFYDSPVEIYTQ